MTTERKMSIELRQAMAWAILVAHRAGEPSVTSSRLAASLLRTPSLAEVCARVGVAPEAAIAAIEDPAAPSFDESRRRIEEELDRRGVQAGSKEHLGDTQPVPLGPIAQAAVQSIFAGVAAPPAVTPLELLLAVVRADESLASRLAVAGLSEPSIRAAIA